MLTILSTKSGLMLPRLFYLKQRTIMPPSLERLKLAAQYELIATCVRSITVKADHLVCRH